MNAEKTKTLKSVLEGKRGAVRERHERGADGYEVCGALCSIVDEVIIGMFEADHGRFDGALVALGGYGRGLLNPFSDVDMLFLLNDAWGATKGPPDTLLAGLWDLGLKVGHSARTITDTIVMGKADITARTAMLEARLLTGNRELFEKFRKKYEREVVRHRPHAFIQEKIDEMTKRHSAFGEVIHLTEPNVKESKGGLRDFHTALWIIRAREEVRTLEELADRGMIGPADVAPAHGAHSYLLRLRNSMHWRAAGPADTLAHELQPGVARMENIEGSGNVASAELMRRYFEAAQAVSEFALQLIHLAKSYRKKWRFRPVRSDGDGLFSDGSALHARSFPPAEFDDDPELLFRIARRLSNENLKPAPNLWSGLEKLARTAPDAWFEGETGGRLLMSLLRLPHSACSLRVLHRTGILARLIPEFTAVTNLSQFDMFHKYTVDEHTLLTVATLESVPDGAPVCGELRALFRAQPNLATIKMALLLHDLGKRAEDHHAVEPDTHTAAILSRLGLPGLIAPVHFLVENHLVMSVTAQRRNFTMPETIRSFCKQVKDRTNLRMLYLLTYADIASVGPDIWNDWKDKILLDLFEIAEKYFIEGEALFLSGPERLKALANGVMKLDRFEFGLREVEDFLARAPERYLGAATPETIAAHMRLVRRLDRRRVALRFAINPGDQTGEVTLASSERLGFFSIVAGAFTAKNLNIIETRIHTFEGHMALDTIVVEGASIKPLIEPEFLGKFEEELADLLEGKRDVAEQVSRRMRYMRTGLASNDHLPEPQALILDHLSETNTVVEIWAPDRLGLLYDTTRTLAELRLNIESAKTLTEGKMAISVFYVTDENGGKVNEAEREKITEALLAAVS